MQICLFLFSKADMIEFLAVSLSDTAVAIAANSLETSLSITLALMKSADKFEVIPPMAVAAYNLAPFCIFSIAALSFSL